MSNPQEQTGQQVNKKKKSFWVIILICLLLLAGIGVGAGYIFRQNIHVIGIGLSKNTAIYGQPLQVKITVENKGLLNAKYGDIVLIDGKEVNIQETRIESNGKTVLSIDITNLMPGDHIVSAGGRNLEFTVYRPAQFSVSELTVDREILLEGDVLTVQVTVLNSGDLTGIFEGELTYDGKPVLTYSESVMSKESRILEKQLTLEEKGDHKISVGNLQKIIQVLSPANILLTDLQLSKNICKLSEPVTLTATFSNEGALTGNHTAELIVNGELIQAKNFDLDPGATEVIEFDVTQVEPGEYTFMINNDDRNKQTLNVYNIIRPKNGTLLIKEVNGGYGELIFENYYSDRDILFVLVDSEEIGKPLMSVYVHADSKTSKINVKDGSYFIYYTAGTDYDDGTGKFISSPKYGMFEDPIIFETTHSGDNVYYKIWTISINKDGGNVNTPSLDEDEFPF